MKKISDLPTKTNVLDTDVIPVESENVTYKTSIYNLRNQTINSNWYILTHLSSPYQSTNQEKILVNLTTDDITVKLPSNPVYGNEVLLLVNNPNTKQLTIDRNGSTIQSQSNNILITNTGTRAAFTYSLDTWVLNFFESGITGIHTPAINQDPDASNPNIVIGNMKEYNCLLLAETITYTLIQKDCILV